MSKPLYSAAIEALFTTWNNGSRALYLKCWADDVSIEHIGHPPIIGKENIELDWDIIREKANCKIHCVFFSIVENEAAVHVRSDFEVEGQRFHTEGFETYTFNKAGEIQSARMYYDTPQQTLSLLLPLYG